MRIRLDTYIINAVENSKTGSAKYCYFNGAVFKALGPSQLGLNIIKRR